MRKTMILAAFIVVLSFSTVRADIALPRPTSVQKPPVTQPPVKEPVKEIDSPKEEQKQGICFSPTVVAGLFFSLSLIAFGLRFLREREIQPKTAKAVS